MSADPQRNGAPRTGVPRTGVPHPSLAEAARTLCAANRQGVLGTLTETGAPYGSLADYLPLADGDAVLFLSRLAEHRRALEADPRASLLIAPSLNRAAGLADERLCLLGAVEAADRAEHRDAYLRAHPQARTYIDFADFGFFRLRVLTARYIAGFGRMGWLDADAYRAAEPDPLAGVAAGALQHMNDDHADSLRDYARAFGAAGWAERVRMSALDRYGFELVCEAGERAESVRIGFDRPLSDAAALRPALVDMARRARGG